MWKGYRRVSRGSVFLLAMVALVCLLFLGTSLVQVAIHGLSFASKQQKRAQALAIAEAGVEMVLEKLYDGYRPHAGYETPAQELHSTGRFVDDISIGGGTAHVVATEPFPGIPNSCEIRSTGVTATQHQETVRVIAVYSDDVSRVFQGAIFCNDNLDLKGGGTVKPQFLDDGTAIGASIYAKGFIEFSTASAFKMDPPDPSMNPPWDGGTGTIFSAAENISDYPANVDPGNVHLDIAPLPMPAIDLSAYRHLAQEHGGKYYDRSQNFTGHTDFSALCTGEKKVVFVEGEVSISGSYTGNAAIVATGLIKVTGSGILASDENSGLALISPKGVRLNGGSEIDALIYSHGVEVQSGGAGVGGNVTINGAIVADVVRTNGGITVQYNNKMWGGIPIPGDGVSMYDQISWEELPE